jgi:hypothetical protein
MGYQRKRKLFKLTFEDPEMAGLEVYAHSTSLENILGLIDLAKVGDKFDVKDLSKLDELFEVFIGALKEWNLEDEEGVPVPPTLAGLKGQDMDFILEMVMAWMEAVVSVSRPLKRKSSSGDQSPEASIPMDVQ